MDDIKFTMGVLSVSDAARYLGAPRSILKGWVAGAGSPDWCIGARLMPYAAHAWIEVEGVPVGESSEPDRPYLLLQRT